MNLNYTLFGQMVAFLAFVAFCAKFIWPFIINAMAERQQKIADGLAAAERADRDLELAQARSTEAMREAKKEAASILEATNKRAAQIIDEAKDQARAEAARILTAAQSEVDQQVKRAKETLRGQVAYLALAGAEKVLEASVDEATHKAMIDKLAANL